MWTSSIGLAHFNGFWAWRGKSSGKHIAQGDGALGPGQEKSLDMKLILIYASTYHGSASLNINALYLRVIARSFPEGSQLTKQRNFILL